MDGGIIIDLDDDMLFVCTREDDCRVFHTSLELLIIKKLGNQTRKTKTQTGTQKKAENDF